MIAAERARLNSVRRPFEIDQRIPMVDLSSLMAQLSFVLLVSALIGLKVVIIVVESCAPHD